jgi:predicted phosphoribosyltransferase
MVKSMSFRDRRDAGTQLAHHLRHLQEEPDLLVLGLPRGGVPVAAEVAAGLSAPLDVLIVRKVGVPGHQELAMGAITADTVYIDYSLVDRLGISTEQVRHVIERERDEVDRRERDYRKGREPLDVHGKTVVVVDDGLATGSTMIAAVRALRSMDAGKVVVAVPVAPSQAVADLEREADEVIVVDTPMWFYAVGQWYVDFSQTSDAEVRRLLSST